MPIVVASGNIFRRELSIFVLGEAGYAAVEVRDAAALIELAADAQPRLLIVDTLLARANPGELLRRLRERSAAPLLWLSQSADSGLALPVDPLSDWVFWPYNPDELLTRVDQLLRAAGTPGILEPTLQQRYAGDPE